jgi:hypothetical protein
MSVNETHLGARNQNVEKWDLWTRVKNSSRKKVLKNTSEVQLLNILNQKNPVRDFFIWVLRSKCAFEGSNLEQNKDEDVVLEMLKHEGLDFLENQYWLLR